MTYKNIIIGMAKEFCAMKEKYSPEEMAAIMANAWKNLDTTGVRDILADNYEYTSQWVLDTMHGADTYLAYLAGKFNAMRNSGRPTVSAFRSDEYYVEIDLEQTINGEKHCGMLQFEIQNGKITKGCMCHPSFRRVE